MSANSLDSDIVREVELAVPFLRRFGRALTGSQKKGDALAAATLEKAIQDGLDVRKSEDLRRALFKQFHLLFSADGASGFDDAASFLEGRANKHLSRLEPLGREAILLNTIEGFSFSDVGDILGLSTSEAEALIARARKSIAESVSGTVLIIEDDAVIGLDLSKLVTDLGHVVVGIAPDYEGAVELGRQKRPDLILADIRLQNERTGMDAVHTLMNEYGEVPTIFVTAFPELYLQGNRPEPTFLIAKPYTEDQIRAAVGQAMFFSSTAVLSNGS